MPEIGLLPFARVALDAATAVLPPYRSRFSKHQFTQPQLLAILCLMRYADWTFREAEVRLREHAELRAVLRLSSVPDHTTVYRFLRRLPDDTIDNVLGESVRRLRRSSRRGRRRACVAVDGTGLAPHAASTYFIRRSEQHAGGKTRYKHFLKWLIVVDVDRQIILAQRARQGPWCDTRALPGLVDSASRTMPIGVVLADAEFDSEANHRHVRGTLGAHCIIPAKPRRGVPRGGIRYQMYRAFPRQLYGPRAKIETVFSVIKRKLSTKAPGRSLPMQMRQALLLGLAFNLYRLRHPSTPAGCKQSHLKSFRIRTYKKTGGGGTSFVASSNFAVPFPFLPFLFMLLRALLRFAKRYPQPLQMIYALFAQNTPGVGCIGFSRRTTHYSLFTIHFFPQGNKLGSAGGVSAMVSNSGKCCRSGSGTFTLEPFKMLISCSALTTPFPW